MQNEQNVKSHGFCIVCLLYTSTVVDAKFNPFALVLGNFTYLLWQNYMASMQWHSEGGSEAPAPGRREGGRQIKLITQIIFVCLSPQLGMEKNYLTEILKSPKRSSPVYFT